MIIALGFGLNALLVPIYVSCVQLLFRDLTNDLSIFIGDQEPHRILLNFVVKFVSEVNEPTLQTFHQGILWGGVLRDLDVFDVLKSCD